jgi:hypothetical protein
MMELLPNPHLNLEPPGERSRQQGLVQIQNVYCEEHARELTQCLQSDVTEVQRAKLAEQGAEYDPAATEPFVRRSMARFGQRLPGTPPPPCTPNPIIVVGLPQ